MRSLKIVTMLLGGLFVSGLGVGIAAGWLNADDPGPVLWPFAGLALFLGGIWLIVLGIRNARTLNDPQEDASDLDMIFGDMSDPVQRRIMSRTALASTIHGFLTVMFVSRDIAPLDAGGGWITIAAYGVFVATLLWIAVECFLFHNIDEFWARVALGPVALAGVGLLIVLVCWLLAEELFTVPQARFWWFYLFYYGLLVGLLAGNWYINRRGRRA